MARIERRASARDRRAASGDIGCRMRAVRLEGWRRSMRFVRLRECHVRMLRSFQNMQCVPISARKMSTATESAGTASQSDAPIQPAERRQG